MYTALFNNLTCRHEACQALIYQLVLGLTGKNGKYNYSKAVHDYPPFSDNTCSAKNYKIALALTLAVYNGERRGGTAATVRYARKLGRRVFILDPISLKVTSE